MSSSEKEMSEHEIVLALVDSVERVPFDEAAFNDAFALLEGKFKEKLMKMLYSMLQNWETAEDKLQETLDNAARSLRQFPAQRIRELHLQAWLFKIAINEVKHDFRKKKPIQVSLQSKIFEGEFLDRLEVQGQERPETAWEAADIRERVLDAIRKLPASYRQTAFLYFIEGYHIVEIMAKLDLPEGTVKSHISRSRHLLKTALKILVDEEE